MAYHQYQQQAHSAPMCTPAQAQYPGVYYQPSPALPVKTTTDSYGYPTEMSGMKRPVEVDTMRGASELSDDTVPQKVEKIDETPKKADSNCVERDNVNPI